MNCLAIDTSSKFLCAAVIKDKKVVAKYNKEHDRQHSVLLLAKIDKLLDSCGVSLGQLNCLAVGTGPGSFTGLRIGIATVKGLSLALNKPILAISSLDLIAAYQNKKADRICVLIDAKRKQVYSARYVVTAGAIKRKRRYFLGTIADALKSLKGKVLFCGDAVVLYKQAIEQQSDIEPVWTTEACWYPNEISFAKLCYDMYSRKDFKNAEQLRALYMYQNTCTVRRKKTE